MFFALPAVETTLLLRCAPKVFTGLSNRVYGLNTLLLEGVLRTLVGEPRAEGATRLNPSAFRRILGMDRSPEVKTIRRQYQGLVDTGKVPELMSLIAFERFAADNNPDTALLGIVYVDGHTRAYEGGKKIGRLHSTRLKMPVPATEETWVSAANGDPLFMVMAQPSASLVFELKALVPKLRAVIGDDRRMLVGFDRGGWSPTLFAHLHKAGFDVLTWRKVPPPMSTKPSSTRKAMLTSPEPPTPGTGSPTPRSTCSSAPRPAKPSPCGKCPKSSRSPREQARARSTSSPP